MTEATHADQLRSLNSRIDDLSESNTKLTATLREAREQIIGLKEEVDRLSAPPNGYAIYLGPAADDLVDVRAFLHHSVYPAISCTQCRDGRNRCAAHLSCWGINKCCSNACGREAV